MASSKLGSFRSSFLNASVSQDVWKVAASAGPRGFNKIKQLAADLAAEFEQTASLGLSLCLEKNEATGWLSLWRVEAEHETACTGA